MRTSRTIAELRAALAERPGAGVGLVPTMGALHGGHEALLRRARDECDVVVASIFVNPAQFGGGEDLESYPRDEQADMRAADACGVDELFVPAVAEMYPEGFQTWVDVERAAQGLEGAARPGHFRGVATVCLKLFNIVRPQRAYFGQKDAQQAAVVERGLVPAPRDAAGPALRPGSADLPVAERAAAGALPRALEAGAAAHRGGGDAAAAARAALAAEPRHEPDYVEVARLNGRVYLLAAARAGRTRLIDNVVLEGEVE